MALLPGLAALKVGKYHPSLLQGLFSTMFSGSSVALVTPMTADGAVDFPCLERLVDMHVEEGTDYLVIAGTTGESATLTRAEHIEVIRVAAQRAAGRIPVVAGTGSNSTAQTIDLSRAVAGFPIDGYLIVTPYYNKPTQEGLCQHYLAIADALDRPVILYNVPGRTGVDMLPETVARVSQHLGIVGIKEATGDLSRLPALRAGCGEDFLLLSGDDATCREFILQGGQGVISVTANVAPALMADMCEAALEGDAAVAAELDARLADLHRDLFIESNPIPVKWALERLGLIPGGLRLPLTPLTASARPVVEAALRRAGLLAAAVLGVALSGCFSARDPDAHCSDPEEYQTSSSVPDVTAPEGLATPNRTSGYGIPALAAKSGSGEANPGAGGAACLARPPDFFRKDPATAPASAK